MRRSTSKRFAAAVAATCWFTLAGCSTDPETEVFEDALDDTTSGEANTGAMETSGGDDGTGLAPDVGTEPTQCQLGTDDCPANSKCSIVMNEREEFEPQCVPISGDDELNQACEVIDRPEGLDTCVGGAVCVSDSNGDNGRCSEFCESNSDCGSEGYCVTRSANGFSACLPACNPLAADCVAPWVCTDFPGMPQWFCQPQLEGQTGGYGSPCVPNELGLCGPGFACIDALAVDSEACLDQPTTVGCCGRICDLSGSGESPCTSDLETCSPLYPDQNVPPGYENIGVCSIPGEGG